MKKDITRAAQQRARREHVTVLSMRLELMLRSLARQVLTGDSTAAVEFQQWIQYAPAEMKDRMLTHIERGDL